MILQFTLCISALAWQDGHPSDSTPQGKAPEPAKQAAAFTPDKKIRILVLVDASARLEVDYVTKGRMGTRVALGYLTVGKIVASVEHSEDSKRLQQTVGAFDRKPLIENSIVAAFGAFSHYFEVVVPTDPSAYRNKEIDFAKVQADGYPYVLAVTEVGGMKSWELKTLSAVSSFHFELLDAAGGKRLGKGRSIAFAGSRRPFDAATTDRSIFVGDYPQAAKLAGFRIYGELNRKGHLHTMAEARGLGNEVPSLDAILERYAGSFRYDPGLPEGWRKINTKSKLLVMLEPKNNDRKQIGVIFVADLLVSELGQDVKDLDEYVALYFGRLGDLGYDPGSAQAFEALKLNLEYLAFILDRPTGVGKEVFLFRMLPDHFVAIYSIVLVRDSEEYLKKYGPAIEDLINHSVITTSGGNHG